MALTGTLVKLGKTYGIEVSSFSYHDKPRCTVHVWPVTSWRIVGMCSPDADMLGKTATLQDGQVSVYLGNGTYFRGALPELGSTKAVSVTEHEVKLPKVRKGTETRWHNYRWEKYLKTKGWVAA